jgi:hypothetical protein
MHAVPYTLTCVADDNETLDRNGVPVGLFEARRADGSRWLEGAMRWKPEPATEIAWLWPGRIPRGQVTVIEGEPGAGKTFVALDFVARVSAGLSWPAVLPLGAAAPQAKSAQVLLVSRSDDDPTVSRRLQALGVDPSRVARMGIVVSCRSDRETGEHRPLELPFDLPMLRHELDVAPSISLVVIDPLSEFCETPKRFEKALRELNDLARERNVAIVVTAPARCRFDVQGTLRVTSRYRTETARCVWCVVADPDNPARRLFVARRTNSFVEPQGLPFHLLEGRVVWNPAVSIDPADPLGQEAAIRDCLMTLMEEGSRRASEIFRLGAQLGFTPNQMRTVAKHVGVVVTKAPGFGKEGCWLWTLAGKEAKDEGGRMKDEMVGDVVEKVAWVSIHAESPVLVQTAPMGIPARDSTASEAPAVKEPPAAVTATAMPAVSPSVNGADENSIFSKSLEKCGETKECLSHRLPSEKEIRRKERKRRRIERRRATARSGR